MRNFRHFEAGPDPFGRKFQVYFKWLQTAITLRHSDSVDVKFILKDEGGRESVKTIALPHPDLLKLSKETGRPVDDPWCARLAGAHLNHLLMTGEDVEKDLVTPSYADMKRHAEELAREERALVSA